MRDRAWAKQKLHSVKASAILIVLIIGVSHCLPIDTDANHTAATAVKGEEKQQAETPKKREIRSVASSGTGQNINQLWRPAHEQSSGDGGILREKSLEDGGSLPASQDHIREEHFSDPMWLPPPEMGVKQTFGNDGDIAYSEAYQYDNYPQVDYSVDYPDYSFEPDSYYYDGGGSQSGFGTFESSNNLKSHDEKRPAVGHGVPQRLDPDMSFEDLQVFLDQFYLIKTPEGYILGRTVSPDSLGFDVSALQQDLNHQLRSPRSSFSSSSQSSLADRAEANHIADLGREDLTKRRSNFQLRVRRSDPNMAKRGRDSFQLRVRKNMVDKLEEKVDEKTEDTKRSFQLRVRKDGKTEQAKKDIELKIRKSLLEKLRGLKQKRSFQLRVRKDMPGALKRAQNFQLRVRKRDGEDHLGEERKDEVKKSFQLRVRKASAGLAQDQDNLEGLVEKKRRAQRFQLRVRKDLPSASGKRALNRNFQLRVRKDGAQFSPEGGSEINEAPCLVPSGICKVPNQPVNRRSFQLRVRKDHSLDNDELGQNNFQSKHLPTSEVVQDSPEKGRRATRDFQLRVRKGQVPEAQDMLAQKRGRNSFQLRVRKRANPGLPGGTLMGQHLRLLFAGPSFQLEPQTRVRRFHGG